MIVYNLMIKLIKILNNLYNQKKIILIKICVFVCVLCLKMLLKIIICNYNKNIHRLKYYV